MIRLVVNVSLVLMIVWVIFFRTPITTLCIGDQMLHLETAYKSYTRKKGLQGVDYLTDREGMLFLYDKPEQRSFWMYDVSIPLDLAWLDGSGRIISIQSMHPCLSDREDCRLYPSPGPITGAVEVRGGWFTDHGITAGDRFFDCGVD